MKVKKNTRYIIKKILIGVGIALILANLRKCNVYADSINAGSSNIQHNYCLCHGSSCNHSYEVVHCSSSELDRPRVTSFELGIKSTLVGADIFTFYDQQPQTEGYYFDGISFGFENLSNGDMLFLNIYNPRSPTSTLFNKFGISNSGYSFLYKDPITDYGNWSRSTYNNIYITEDYSRALDLYNSNIVSISSSYKYMSHVDNYYFVVFEPNDANYNFTSWISYIGSPWVMNQLNGDSYYSSFESNLYIIELDSSYSPTAVGIDIQLEDESNNLSINPQDYWLQGFASGGDSFLDDSCSDGGLCSENIESYIDFFKIPFDFINSLSRDKCQKILIPIPFVNGNIEINCLSSIFENVLGSNFYNIIFYLITGLYAYRITIMNIDTITDILNPTDDKLEVIDL